jgi:hypothetical protein
VAFPSLARESSRPPTRRPREPHRRNGGWRHPPPSGSPSGPVGPSGRNSNPDFPVQPRRPLGAKRNLEGGRGRVKAMFPLARRVCPAQDGRTTSMEFPVMSPASGQARPGAHRFTCTATGAMARMFAAWSRVRRSKQPAAYARKVLLNRHLLERPSPGGPSRPASRVIAAGTAPWSHPYRPCPRRALANRYEQVTSGHDGSLRSVLSWPFGVGAGAALPRGSAFRARDPGAAHHRKATDNSGR